MLKNRVLLCVNVLFHGHLLIKDNSFFKGRLTRNNIFFYKEKFFGDISSYVLNFSMNDTTSMLEWPDKAGMFTFYF